MWHNICSLSLGDRVHCLEQVCIGQDITKEHYNTRLHVLCLQTTKMSSRMSQLMWDDANILPISECCKEHVCKEIVQHVLCHMAHTFLLKSSWLFINLILYKFKLDRGRLFETEELKDIMERFSVWTTYFSYKIIRVKNL